MVIILLNCTTSNSNLRLKNKYVFPHCPRRAKISNSNARMTRIISVLLLYSLFFNTVINPSFKFLMLKNSPTEWPDVFFSSSSFGFSKLFNSSSNFSISGKYQEGCFKSPKNHTRSTNGTHTFSVFLQLHFHNLVFEIFLNSGIPGYSTVFDKEYHIGCCQTRAQHPQ